MKTFSTFMISALVGAFLGVSAFLGIRQFESFFNIEIPILLVFIIAVVMSLTAFALLTRVGKLWIKRIERT